MMDRPPRPLYGGLAHPRIDALFTQILLWHNCPMPRWVSALILMVLGGVLGVFYGWKVNPVKFVDTAPASLRVDFRTDYVLMVAEAYHSRQDADAARRQLSIFGGQSYASLCLEALRTAEQTPYSRSDIALLEELARAVQTVSSTAAPGQGSP